MTTTTQTEALRQATLTCHQTRQDALLATELLDGARRLWEQENANLLVKAKETRDLAGIAERQLRDLALQVYEETADKRPSPGVNIRLVQHMSYDHNSALVWAKEHNLALELNKKAFESIASSEPMPFVQITQEPQATIARDLAAALAEAEKQDDNES